MADILDSAFIVAKQLYEGQYFAANVIVVKDLMALCNLSDEAFDLADTYLLQKGYCEGTLGGQQGTRVLTEYGVDFVTDQQSAYFNLSCDAQAVARYLVEKRKENRGFVSTGEICRKFGWEQDDFFEVAQELVDEGLAEEMPRIEQIRFGGLKLTTDGSRAVRLNFRKPEASIAVQVSQHFGDQIQVSQNGDGNAIAAGRNASASAGLSGEEINALFRSVYDHIERLSADTRTKTEVRDTVDLIRDEAQKGEQANTKAIKTFLRNLMRMAPDIFDVVVATLVSPAAGITMAVKKIAEKAKEEAGDNPG